MSIRDETEISHAELTIRNDLKIVSDPKVAFGKLAVHLCLLWVLKMPGGEQFDGLLTDIRELAEMSNEEQLELFMKLAAAGEI